MADDIVTVVINMTVTVSLQTGVYYESIRSVAGNTETREQITHNTVTCVLQNIHNHSGWS